MARRKPAESVTGGLGRNRRARARHGAAESRETEIDVLVLAASAGGEAAVREVLSGLQPNFRVPIIVAQHLAPQSKSAEVYARSLPFAVGWARAGSNLKPGKVLVCPPRSYVELLPDGTCAVSACEAGASGRPIDRLLESVGRSFGARSIGVILSGMLDDGAAGALHLRAAGGTVVVQAETSAEYPSMPRAALKAGGADFVAALGDIAQLLTDLASGTRQPRARSEVEAIGQLFCEEGEIASTAREIDWSKTPLGHAVEWPESLRVVLRLVLKAAYPMAVWWGRDLVQIYNESWRAFIGAAVHPAALGKPAAETSAEVWHDFGPVVQRVLAEGKAVFRQDHRLLLRRDGTLEEVYVTISHSPICDQAGDILGVLHTGWDTTTNVVAERRARALRKLGAELAGVGTPRDVCHSAAIALASVQADIPFALLYLATENRGHAALAGATGFPAGSPAAPHAVAMDADSDVWALARVLAKSTALQSLPVVLDDVPRRLAALPLGAGLPPELPSPQAAMLLPLRAAADAPALGVLVAGLNPHCPLDVEYRSFLDLVVQQINATLAEARARQLERERLGRMAELDRAKTEFFANVSHEFRTPLTLMLGPMEGLLRDRDQLSKSAEQQLQVVARNARRLLGLVNNLLDFSQIEARRHRANLELTDLSALTVDVASAFRSAIEAAGLRFRVACDPNLPPLPVDRDMWETIVSNLLSNALKFTFNGEIAVELTALRLHAQLTVSDTGAGIPRQEMANLFKRFHRIPGTRGRTAEGSGIGLSMVQDLLTRMGGQIRATSRKGRGTTFILWMPFKSTRIGTKDDQRSSAPTAATGTAIQLASEAARWLVGSDDAESALEDLLGPSTASGPAAEGGVRPRIVVVDDNGDMRDYLRRILSPLWEVEVAADGESALAILRNTGSDLLLADVMMPKLDGFALLKQIRADPSLRMTPVVLVTARAGEQAAIEGLLAGADDYIAKPFSARELVARVGGQLALSRMRRRAEELNAFLVRFSDAVRGSTDARAVADLACRMIVEQLGADRGHWTEVDWATKEWVLESGFVVDGVTDTSRGRYPLDEWEPNTSGLLEGRTGIIDDAQADQRLPLAVKQGMAKLEVAARIAVPVMVDGRLRAVQIVHQRSPRRWMPDEVALVEGVAARCWAEIERARAAQALRESENRLAALFEALPVGVAAIDRGGATLLSNPVWQRFLPSKTIPSRDLDRGWRWQIWQDDGRPCAPQDFPAARALRGEYVLPGVDALYTQDDGRQIWARVAAVPFRDAGGEIAGVFAVISDVDALKRTAEDLRVSQARQAFLLKLSDTLRPLTDAVAIKAAANRVLGEQLRADRTYYVELDRDRGMAVVERDYVRGDGPSLAGAHPTATFEATLANHRAGQPTVCEDAVLDPHIRDADRPAYLERSLRSFVTTPLIKDGELMGAMSVTNSEPRVWRPEEVALVVEVAERTWDAVQRARAEAALRASEAKLAVELADAEELQRVSSTLIKEDDVDALYRQIMDAARSLMRSDTASIQRLVPERNELHLMAQHGFPPESTAFWEWVKSDDPTSCGQALARSEPVVIANIEASQALAETEDLTHYRRSGIQAMLSMPLLARDGQLVGVMSTHWRRVHQPSPRELRMLNVLARQAADLIERGTAELQLREGEARAAFLMRLGDALRAKSDADEIERTAEQMLVEHLDVTEAHVAYYGDEVVEVRSEYRRSGPSLVGRYAVAAWQAVISLLRSGRPLLVGDPTEDPPLSMAERAQWAALGIVSQAAVPILREGRLLATLAICDSKPRAWTPRDLDFLTETANRTWEVIERARAESALRRSEENQSMLSMITKELVSLSSAHETITRLAQPIGRHFGAKWCLLAELRDEQETVTSFVWHDATVPPMTGTYRVRDFLCDAELARCRAGEPSVVDDARIHPAVNAANLEAVGIRSFVVVPVLRDGAWLYLVSIADDSPRVWTSDEIALLSEIANRVSSRLDRARADKVIRDSEERYRSLFESMDEPFALAEAVRDSAGKVVDVRFLAVNVANQRMTGLTRAQVVGKLRSELPLPPDPGLMKLYSEVLDSGRTIRIRHDSAVAGRSITMVVFPQGEDRLATLVHEIVPVEPHGVTGPEAAGNGSRPQRRS